MLNFKESRDFVTSGGQFLPMPMRDRAASLGYAPWTQALNKPRLSCTSNPPQPQATPLLQQDLAYRFAEAITPWP